MPEERQSVIVGRNYKRGPESGTVSMVDELLSHSSGGRQSFVDRKRSSREVQSSEREEILSPKDAAHVTYQAQKTEGAGIDALNESVPLREMFNFNIKPEERVDIDLLLDLVCACFLQSNEDNFLLLPDPGHNDVSVLLVCGVDKPNTLSTAAPLVRQHHNSAHFERKEFSANCQIHIPSTQKYTILYLAI